MKKFIYLSALAIMAFSAAAYAQPAMTKDDPMKSGFVSVEEAAKTALNVGAKMPAFTLNDSLSKSVSSKDLLKQGNLVLVFYRGAWCPFCNKYLHQLQQSLPQIKQAGGNLVAISVEPPDRSIGIAKKNELEFTVLSDPNLTVARMFHIVYQLPDATNERYKKGGLDLATYNHTEKAELPISATYIVDKKGKVVYAYIEPDYKKRAEPSILLAELAKIKK
jgi:peroxiredoxin